MSDKLTRRDALKLGTGAAISVATPLFDSAAEKLQPSVATNRAPGSQVAVIDSSAEICFMRAVDILEAIRKKRISSREVMQAHLKQIHFGGREPGDVDPVHFFQEWAAHWNPDRWASPRRLGSLATGLRLRTSYWHRQAPPNHRLGQEEKGTAA